MGASGEVHVAFGTVLRAEFPLPELAEAGDGAAIDTELVWAEAAEIDAVDTPVGYVGTEHWGELGGGRRFRVQSGRNGDLLVQLDGQARFQVAADGSVVRCSPADPDDMHWRRFVLGTVLGTVALMRGYEILHAAAYERPEGAVAIVASSGGGKSTLLAELVRRGRPLFSDDLLVMSSTEGEVAAHPGPPLLTTVSPLPDGTLATEIGEVLAEIDGETWVAVPASSSRPRAVAAIAFLERGGDEPLVCDRLPANVMPLLSHALHSGSRTDRLRARFELLSDVGKATPLLRLMAPLGATPSACADALEATVDGACATAP